MSLSSTIQLLKPHSREWFKSLNAFSLQQAKHTAQIIRIMGRNDVCSICGDEKSTDYLVSDNEFEPGVPATVRLCSHCKSFRENGIGVTLIPLLDKLSEAGS